MERDNRNAEEIRYGKFPSADKLYDAYVNLENEFTRKCQRIKELEQAYDKASEHSQTAGELDRIFQENAALEQYSDSIRENFRTDGNIGVAIARSLKDRVLDRQEPIGERFLKERVYPNNEVMGMIYTEMIQGIAANKAPRTIGERGQITVMPPVRPTSLDEASKIAANMLNNGRF